MFARYSCLNIAGTINDGEKSSLQIYRIPKYFEVSIFFISSIEKVEEKKKKGSLDRKNQAEKLNT